MDSIIGGQRQSIKRRGQPVLLAELRTRVVEVGLDALKIGIVHGTAGNMSERDPGTGLIAISPSGMPYPTVTPADVVIVDENAQVHDGKLKPSSETPMHTMIYRNHPRVRVIVHTHSHFSTVVSTMRDCLPPILTEVCLVVGPRVPVTRYGLTGTQDIGKSVVEMMDDTTKAVILKNHGLITFGTDFAEALMIAELVEESAKVYIHALAANGGREPNLIPERLIPEMRERFMAMYGQQ